MSSWKGLLCFLGAIGLAYLGQRQQQDGAVAALFVGFLQAALIAMGVMFSIYVGILLFMWSGEDVDADTVDKKVIGAATLGVVYGVLILMLASGKFYREDRAEARDYLMDRAVEFLEQQGEPVNVANLKWAMRWVVEEQAGMADDPY